MAHHLFPALATAAGLVLTQPQAHAAEECYDFSGLAAGTRWGIHTTVPIDIGEVRIRPLIMNGQPFEADKPENQYLRRQDQQIAGGTAPEIYGAYIAMQIVPRQRVRALRMKFAQEQGASLQRHSFIEVNGEQHAFEGLLSKVNGRTLGQGTSWRAEARAQLAPTGPNSLWHAGTLAVRSTQGGIDQVTIGTQFFRVDDVCIER